MYPGRSYTERSPFFLGGRLKRFIVLFLLLCLIRNVIPAPGSDKRIYRTQRLTGRAPVIDGELDDACWSQGVWTGDFVQQQPNEGEPGTQKTEFKILYDDTGIYAAFRAHDDEPEKMEIRVARRDDFSGDLVGICFDSYYDHRTGYEFILNSSGSKTDLIQMDTGADWFYDTNWDAVWDGETAIGDSGWTAEMRIPFSQLRFARKQEHVWGLHVWRWLHRSAEESQFQLIPLDSQGRVHRFGILEGIHGIPDPRRVELLPYVRGSLNRFQPEADNPFAASGRKEAGGLGLDGRIGLSGNFNLDFTVNPDFGQVEADPSVVNLTAFETFYEEKRPFFMEGKQVFDFDLNGQSLFYSRRIGRAPRISPEPGADEYTDSPEITTILGAAKVTGKTANGWSLGILSSLTSEEKAEISKGAGARKQTVEPLAHYAAARAQRDFAGGNHSLGAIFTAMNRRIGEDHLNVLPRAAYSGGVDATLQWGGRSYFFNAKAVFSHIRGSREAIAGLQNSSVHYYNRTAAAHLEVDSSRTSLSGSGGEIEIGRGGNGRWRFAEEFSWRSPGLDLNEIGYLRQADLIENETRLAYVVTRPAGIFLDYEISLSQANMWSFNRERLGSGWRLFPRARFANFWSMHGYIERSTNRLQTRLLRGGPAMRLPDATSLHLHLLSDSRKRVRFHLGLFRTLYDDAVSDEWSLWPDLMVRATDNLDFSLMPRYSVNRDNWQYVTTAYAGAAARYILGRIDQKTASLTLRLNYYVTPDFSIQYYGQPFISAGHFSDYKRITQPQAERPDLRYQSLAGAGLGIDPGSGDLSVDEDGDGSPDYGFANPSFNFREFRSNLVLRWEYRPGSTLYLVWTHGRSRSVADGGFDFSSDLEHLLDIYPDNVFLIKFNHWFSL